MSTSEFDNVAVVMIWNRAPSVAGDVPDAPIVLRRVIVVLPLIVVLVMQLDVTTAFDEFNATDATVLIVSPAATPSSKAIEYSGIDGPSLNSCPLFCTPPIDE